VVRAMAANRLIVMRHYEPPSPEEAAELLCRVYDRLLRLTHSDGEGTMPEPEGDDWEGTDDARGALRQGVN
jgi:hypothetical protein